MMVYNFWCRKDPQDRVVRVTFCQIIIACLEKLAREFFVGTLVIYMHVQSNEVQMFV